jgi:hypothetical protein
VISTGRASTLFRWRDQWHGGMVPHRGTAGGTLREIHADEAEARNRIEGRRNSRDDHRITCLDSVS